MEFLGACEVVEVIDTDDTVQIKEVEAMAADTVEKGDQENNIADKGDQQENQNNN